MPRLAPSIRIHPLPARSRRLAPAELSAIYGGCAGDATNPYAPHPCDTQKDCCDGYRCEPAHHKCFSNLYTR